MKIDTRSANIAEPIIVKIQLIRMRDGETEIGCVIYGIAIPVNEFWPPSLSLKEIGNWISSYIYFPLIIQRSGL
jgi:hypothetical protein